MEVKEHFYAEDPARGPVDGRTSLAGAEYFFLGNGLVQAAVQVAAAAGATPAGLLIMDPERFGPKRAAPTFDPGSGLAATAVSLAAAGRTFAARPGAVRARWALECPFPRVELRWSAGPFAVAEELFCPDARTARLLRRVTVSARAGSGGGGSRVRLRTGLPGRSVEAGLAPSPGRSGTAVFEYRLARSGGRAAVSLRVVPDAGEPAGAAAAWAGTATVRSHDPLLDRFFAASKYQLRAAVAASGRQDGGIWQYNLEWVRDQSFIALALAMTGQEAAARTMFARLLDELVDDRGATMDSSRFRPWRESEFDQNGILLFALSAYLDWTGDRDLVAGRWRTVERTAAFPLRPDFRHPASGLLVNRREYWERHSGHGIRPGMELAHQLHVAMGLKAAGRMAGLLGRRAQAARWTAAAESLREALLRSPRFSLVSGGRFVKRRGLDGRVQAEIRPPADSPLPREAPLFEPGRHLLDPDTSAVLPVAWEFVDPAGALARRTLASMEALWDQRWTGGGYGRYNVTSEADSPGPWPFASLFVARAAIEAGDMAGAARVLDWLGRAPGGRAAAWPEFYGPRPVPPYPPVGIIPWTWAEMIFVFVHHLLGVRPAGDAVRVRPRLLPGQARMEAVVPVRGARLELAVRRARPGETPRFVVDGRRLPYHLFGVAVELPGKPGPVAVRAVIP
jgi:hypothetical protein